MRIALAGRYAAWLASHQCPMWSLSGFRRARLRYYWPSLSGLPLYRLSRLRLLLEQPAKQRIEFFLVYFHFLASNSLSVAHSSSVSFFLATPSTYSKTHAFGNPIGPTHVEIPLSSDAQAM